MRALVVYESVFGNTKQVAEAIAGGLGITAHVDTVEVGSAPRSMHTVDLLVVGGPTHAFSMSRPATRQDARRAAKTVSAGDGIREWIGKLDGAARAFATFDTKVRKPKLPGSAARSAARRLRKRAMPQLAEPQTFFVDDREGPVSAAELDRARRWGSKLGTLLAQRVPH